MSDRVPALRAWALLLAAAALPACSGVLGEDDALVSAHAVFLTRPDCPYVVAKTTGRGYTVLAAQTPYAPARGDLLVGNLHAGRVALELVPFPGDEAAGTLPFDVVDYNLRLADAQGLWRRVCEGA